MSVSARYRPVRYRMDSVLKSQHVYRIFETISGNYDRANERISLGLQKSWKELLVNAISETMPLHTNLLDVCCGTGDIPLLTAQRRPDIRSTGIDFSPAMLAEARRKSSGTENIIWKEADAMHLPFPDNTFAAVCISFGLRNTPDYHQVLNEMKRVAVAGGSIYCLDSFIPDNTYVRGFYTLYFKYIMPLLGGGKKYRTEYTWLYTSTQKFLRKKELIALYEHLGLTHITQTSRMFGACILVQGIKPEKTEHIGNI